MVSVSQMIRIRAISMSAKRLRLPEDAEEELPEMSRRWHTLAKNNS